MNKDRGLNRFSFTLTFIIFFGILNAQETNSAYLALGHDSIFYDDAGSGDVIILIHDGLLHREVWDDQFSFFSGKYRVIRYDRRGYGNSSAASGKYSHLDDLNALFSKLEIDNACLIASSSGGALAIDYTLKYPQCVSDLILVGAVVGGFSYTEHFITRGGYLPTDFNDDEDERLYYVSDDPYALYSNNIEAKEKAIELVKKNPNKIYKRPSYNHQSIPAYWRLNEIKIPTLILVGEFDLPDIHAAAGAINAGIQNSKREIIPKSGHLIPLEQPVLFNEAVMKFLNTVSK